MTIEEKYSELFPVGMSWGTMSEKLNTLENDEDIVLLRKIYCNEIDKNIDLI